MAGKEKDEVQLRLSRALAEGLKHQADEFGVSLTIYLALLVRQQLKTPMEIKLKAG